MGSGVESRFERYAEKMVDALGHASRATPGRWYLRGLMLPGERKSVEPMAARVHPQDVESAHQSMHHLVADSDWSDTALLAAVAHEVVPVLSQGQARCFWIIDDTSYRKYGKHSVGVARQYCGHLGKTENCQVAVSLTLATEEGSLPLAYRLYLPQEWTRNKKRCRAGGVPKAIGFAPKGKIAWAQIEAALAAGIPRGTVLMDAAYGDEAAMRDRLSAHDLSYAVAIRPATTVWGGASARSRTAQADPRPAPHPRATRCEASADQRARACSRAAGGELLHDSLA
jgi:SRSO17 transposase